MIIQDKYIDKFGRKLHEIAIDGFADDTYGSVTEDEIWIGLILEHKAIIQEDSQGFFDYATYDTEEKARKEFDKMSEKINSFKKQEFI